MKVVKALIDTLGYLTEGALEIFSPNHDSYPLAGLQPYSGDIYRPSRKSHYSRPIAKISHT